MPAQNPPGETSRYTTREVEVGQHNADPDAGEQDLGAVGVVEHVKRASTPSEIQFHLISASDKLIRWRENATRLLICCSRSMPGTFVVGFT